MKNPAHVLENNKHKLLWDFDIHSDHQFSAIRPHQIIINKKKRTSKIVDFAVPTDHRIKLKECETKYKYLYLAKKIENTKEHAGDNYTNCNWCIWNSNLRNTKGTGELGTWRTSGEHPNYSSIENDQNSEKSPGDVRRLAVSQTPGKDHQLALM